MAARQVAGQQAAGRQVAGRRVAVIGGGAAGYFAAIRCAEVASEAGVPRGGDSGSGDSRVKVVLFEATQRPLLKVLVSGGGRCNVTHHCFEPAELIKGYPRGSQELRGAFSRFQPSDTVAWFEERGVRLKAEADGRMFPVTDQSSTIAECLQQAAVTAGVEIRLGARTKEIRRTDEGRFELTFREGAPERFDAVLLATGSTPSGYKMAASLGHKITPLAPSLFTFTMQDERLNGLSGISVPRVKLQLAVEGEKTFEQVGPLLITHWGLSGPAVLKLSAWGARELMKANYHAQLTVNWLPEMWAEKVLVQLAMQRKQHPTKAVSRDNFVLIPKRLWAKLTAHAGIDESLTWSNVSKEQTHALAEELSHGTYRIVGKGEFKEEFVTCGGVSLKEVDFRTMGSKVCAGLYFAGEILDIDGITGGYNFQSAWTTGWIAGGSMGQPRPTD